MFRKILAVIAMLFAFSASAANRSGLWWNPNESGWGITIADHDNNLFVAAYVYGQTGKPLFFSISGGTYSADGKVFSSRVTLTKGPTSPTIDATRVTRRDAGPATITFASDTTATFSYTIDGVTVTKAIQKFNFWKAPYDSWPSDYSEMWWNANESGWGVNIAQNADKLFAIAYLYDEVGDPSWFAVSDMSLVGSDRFTGAISTSTGPFYGAGSFNPNTVTRAFTGTATAEFTDHFHGNFSYTLNGVSRSTQITRLPFGMMPKLFMGAFTSMNGNSPFSVFNRWNNDNVEDFQQLFTQMNVVDGFAFNPISKKVHIAARGGGVGDQGTMRFPLYNMSTGTIETGPNLGTESALRTPVVCYTNGACFYGLGFNNTGNSISTGRIEVVKNNLKTKSIPLPDQNANRIPNRMVVDGDLLYVLANGPNGIASSFTVVSLTSESVLRSCSIGSEALDMDVTSGVVYVSVFRDASSGMKDVLIFNGATCSNVASIAIPAGNSVRDAYVTGLRFNEGVLHLACRDGVRNYSLPNLSQVAFFPSPTGERAYEMTYGYGELYVTFPDTTIVVLDPVSLSLKKTLTKNVWDSRIYAIEFSF